MLGCCPEVNIVNSHPVVPSSQVTLADVEAEEKAEQQRLDDQHRERIARKERLQSALTKVAGKGGLGHGQGRGGRGHGDGRW